MSRIVIARAGAFVAIGFLLASAIANFMFGISLGRTGPEGMLIGIVGVFAVAMNALSPFFISWSLAATRKTTAASIIVLWSLCLTYSTTSALGFAAQNREGVAVSRQIMNDGYADTRRELIELENRRSDAKPRDRGRLDAKVDDVRRRLTKLRSNTPAPADAQSEFLSVLTFGLIEARHVRIALVALFAVMVEMGATLGLFAALSHSFEKTAPTVSRWTRKSA